MIDLKCKSDCCGCYACINVCPKKCISMEIDEEGFWYPIVDENKCVKCGLCERVCPIVSKLPENKHQIKIYACKNINDIDRKNSSSGGVFTLLCEEIIKSNGVIFGAAFDEEFEVVHSYAESMEECKKYRGSKYVQSIIGNQYSNVKKFLLDGRLVLFSGTQCQIKGLKLFLGRNYDNLFTVEIICHGVPSPLVFRKYRESLRNRYNSNIKDINFRDKSLGWNKFSYVAKFESDDVYSKDLNSDIYMRGFLKNLYLRPSCYECKAKNFTSNSDISLADYWGVEKLHKELYDDNGISLVIVNTKQGYKIWNKIIGNLKYEESDLSYAVENNPCIVKPVVMNRNRTKFFNMIKKKSLEYSIEKCLEKGIYIRIKSKIKSVIIKIMRKN